MRFYVRTWTITVNFEQHRTIILSGREVLAISKAYMRSLSPLERFGLAARPKLVLFYFLWR